MVEKIIFFFLILERNLVNTIYYYNSMVNLNYDLVKMKPNRVMELSFVNQSLLERLSMVISADKLDYSLNIVCEVTVRLICVTTTVNLANSDIGLISGIQRSAVLDLILLDLGKSDRIRLIWKPGFMSKQSKVRIQREMMKIGLAKTQHERLIMVILELFTAKLKTVLSFKDKICAKIYSFYNQTRFSVESGESKKWKKGCNAKGEYGDSSDDYKKGNRSGEL